MAGGLRQLPNLITTARILTVPVIVWLVLRDFMAEAFWLFLIAGVSDGIDGWIARRFDARTRLGTWLDPLADKLLIVGTFVALGWQNWLPVWLVMAVVFRDLMIVGGVMLGQTVGQPFAISPSKASKVNTAAQIAMALAVLAMAAAFLPGDAALNQRHWQTVIDLLMVVVAATTALSGTGYLVRWLRHAGRHDDTPGDQPPGA
ncbi:CDP-alcohol phosphatidyltransferase family protein [Tistrella bauzanensis]|jgi:cardiolipin synthase|uniref:CDP-diacylglycerol--glycerol-3-phosphate 3-phosphatidyltransferase n=1 Tax=Tistrella arctica TaxID=3133430 RepID=A0ABU9YE77_9PROT